MNLYIPLSTRFCEVNTLDMIVHTSVCTAGINVEFIHFTGIWEVLHVYIDVSNVCVIHLHT